MLVDNVNVRFTAGHGGAGRVSFRPGKKAGPDGGDGGRGGHIYISGVKDIYGLSQFNSIKEIKAENGEMGGKNFKTGKDGADLTIRLPIGTDIIIDQKVIEVIDSKPFMICRGGIGGLGNNSLKSARNTTPMKAQTGRAGESIDAVLNLKLIADFGLVGIPSSGKSSLLNELTSTQVKVGDYPFTTLEPNLGVIDHKVIADIPGLIENAHLGRGLGIKFLQHIQKVSTLLFCLEANRDQSADYQMLLSELKHFDETLVQKPKMILITKSDLVSPEIIDQVTKKFKKLKLPVLPVSIYDYDSIRLLQEKLKILN